MYFHISCSLRSLRKYAFPLRPFRKSNTNNSLQPLFHSEPGRQPEGKRSSPTARMHNRLNNKDRLLTMAKNSHTAGVKNLVLLTSFPCREKAITKTCPMAQNQHKLHMKYPNNKTKYCCKHQFQTLLLDDPNLFL